MRSMADETFKTFEDGMRALEELVRNLEQGDLPLEGALSAFEQGVQLVRQLNERLSDAEARVEVLTRAPDGSLQLQFFDNPRTRKE